MSPVQSHDRTVVRIGPSLEHVRVTSRTMLRLT
jgi:hypothetical protein